MTVFTRSSSQKIISDVWNTILSDIKQTQTSFFERQTNSNMSIYWWSNSNTLFLASKERTSNLIRFSLDLLNYSSNWLEHHFLNIERTRTCSSICNWTLQNEWYGKESDMIVNIQSSTIQEESAGIEEENGGKIANLSNFKCRLWIFEKNGILKLLNCVQLCINFNVNDL